MHGSILYSNHYAYQIDPHKAMMSAKDLFDTRGENNPFNDVFGNREIKELIIPHIFMVMLKALHSEWNEKSKKDPNDKDYARNKVIISKDIVKYYILSFISKSMSSISDPDDKEKIENKLIEIFNGLDKKDSLPTPLINIAEQSFNNFMMCFDNTPGILNSTYETRLNELRKKKQKFEPFEIMSVLKSKYAGDRVTDLYDNKEHFIQNLKRDPIKEELLKLLDLH